MAAVSVCHVKITEKWIRERLNLRLDSLHDVRSLALPGSYQEKITHLGRSLLGFTNLKHLDLSRNALESLEGLDHLVTLETLNLYYNGIASLNELFRLRHNPNLKELDLRLNPVTKNEPDYRLFLVHMLINLRRLDDRGVRDSERKAAIMHFDSDQAHDFVRPHPEAVNPKEPHSTEGLPKHIKSRRNLVQSFAPRPTALDDDTDKLLDLISKTEAIPTSTKLAGSEGVDHHGDAQQGNWSPVHLSSPGQVVQRGEHPQSQAQAKDPNLVFTDELEAYHTVKVKANFTPAPVSMVTAKSAAKPSGHRQPKRTTSLTKEALQDAVRQLLELFEQHSKKDVEPDEALQVRLGQWLQQLVAEHGPPGTSHPHDPSHPREGSEELQGLHQQLSLKESELASRERELADLKRNLQEVMAEREAIARSQAQVRSEELNQMRLSSSGDDGTAEQLEALRLEVKQLRDENASLRTAVDQAPPITTSEMASLHKHLSQLKQENDSLRTELQSVLALHDQELQHYVQVQELAAMLQESHRALVATNDRLLQDLEETKERHRVEKDQMGKNYQHLRNNIEILQSIRASY